MEAEKNNNVIARKDFTVNVEELFKAWTDGEQLKQWWKPLGSQLTDVLNEVEHGGKIEYKFRAEDKENLVITGEYMEAIPNEKLVYTWNWKVAENSLPDSEYVLKVEFKGADNGSSIEVSQENNQDQEAIHPHQHGWKEALNHLASYLESRNEHPEADGAASSPSDHEGKPDYGSQNPATV